MIDVKSLHNSAKCMWIKRLLDKNISKWKVLMLYMLNIKDFQIDKNLSASYIEAGRTSFHRQILSSWLNGFTGEPKNFNGILNQYILYNQYISVGSKSISPADLKPSGLSLEIANLKLVDIINLDGSFLTIKDFNNKFYCNIDTFRYQCLLSAIPKTWKKELVNHAPIVNLTKHKTISMIVEHSSLIPIPLKI